MAWLPVMLVLPAATILSALRLETPWEIPGLLATFNTLFCASAALLVAYLSAQTYLGHHSRGMLSLGAGSVVFGVTYLLAGPLLHSQLNVSLVVHNGGMLLAAVLFMISAIQAKGQRTGAAAAGGRAGPVVVLYVAAASGVGLLVLGAVVEVIPDFTTPRGGFTPLRQAVLGSAVLGFLIAAVLYARLHIRTQTRFSRWFCLGLAMLGVGLASVGAAPAPATPLSWLGRIVQWLGGVYMLLAILSTIGESGSWRIPLERALEQAARSLQRERDLLQTVMNSTPNFHLVYLDRDFNFVRVNETYARTCGYTPEEMIGKNHFDLYPDAENEAIFTRVRDTGVAAEYVDKPFSFPDQPQRGVTYWDWTLLPVKDKDGAVQGLVFSLMDTTEQVRLRQRAQQGEQRLRLALEAGQMAAWDWHVPTGETIWNDAHYTMMGYKPGDVTPGYRAWADRVHPLDLPATEASLKQALKERGSYAHEFRTLWPDGTVRWLEARGRFESDASGEVVRSYGVMMDTTEAKRVQAALALSEERFRVALQGSPVTVAAMDLDLRYTWVYNTRHGFTPEMVIGKRPDELIDPQDVQELMSLLKHVLATGQAQSREVSGRTRGVAWCYLARAEPLRNDGGEMVGLTVAQIDISDRKAAEDALRKTAEELARSNRELEQFAYITSHDLQEPLRQVRSFVQLLWDRHRDKLEDRAGEYLQFINEGAERMSSLVLDLLTYSRVGAGERMRQTVSSSKAVAAALANLGASIAETGVEVVQSDLPDVQADPTQMVQLFQNLIGNAIKFRREGVAPKVEIGATREGSHWRFWVKDNGIGIEPEFHDRVFLIFQRLHTRQQYAGTGIGLAICKKIVEQHGGRIWIESVPRQGSTFCFSLPQ